MTVAAPIEVKNVDVEFEVYDGDVLTGRLSISRGGVDWKPARRRSAKKRTWKQLADWMEA